MYMNLLNASDQGASIWSNVNVDKTISTIMSMRVFLTLCMYFMAFKFGLVMCLLPVSPVQLEVVLPTTTPYSELELRQQESASSTLIRHLSWVDNSSIHVASNLHSAAGDDVAAVSVSSHLSTSLYKAWKTDSVVRVVDANTVKLEKQGLVTMAGMQMPSAASSNFQFPDCFDKSPSYKIRKLIPKGTKVRVRAMRSPSSASSAANSALIVKDEDGTLINAALFAVFDPGVTSCPFGSRKLGSTRFETYVLWLDFREIDGKCARKQYRKWSP